MSNDVVRKAPKVRAEIADVAKAADKTIDSTAEVIEAVRSGTNFKVVGAVLLVAGVAVGAASGYFYAKRKMQKYYEFHLAQAKVEEVL